MSSRHLLPLVCAGAFLLGLPARAIGSESNPPRPNFVFVLIDDMGYADLSCYGSTNVQTAHIDRVAQEGLRFTQFTVGSPICSPSRTAFTTGQNPARWRITSYLASRRENERRGMAQWLDPAAPSLARMLKSAGYTTGHFGKWHMGGQRDVGEAPFITEYGFDESLTQFEGLGDRILPLLNTFDGEPPRRYALGSDQLGRGNITWMDRSQVTGAFVTNALEFIKQAESSGKPFYVNLWPDDVHSPFFPPKALRSDGSKRELYLGVVRAMDEQLAPLFDYLRNRPNLRTNTVLVIASDNGPEPGAGLAGRFRGHKGMLYEGGFREPFIVWAPGFMPASACGTTNEQSVLSAVDLLPSVAALAGVTLPPDFQPDGEDLSDTLLGRSRRTRSSPLFWSRPPDRPGPNAKPWPDLAIRQGNWKLLMQHNGESPELYDLDQDPGETQNRAADHPEKVRELKKQLLDWSRPLPLQFDVNDTESSQAAKHADNLFINPIAEGADPWITRHEGKYIVCLSDANRGVALHISDQLSVLGRKQVVWTAPPNTPCSAQVWAPELHFLNGRWYVYFAASDGENRNHRMWVLQSASDDPLGPYRLHGPLYTGDHPELTSDNRWAIDGTVFELADQLYFVWSGWQSDRDEQWLYIAPMEDPLTVAAPRVRLAENDDHVWERVGERFDQRGLNEAPQILQHNGRTFLTYSCSGSWQPTYKMGFMELRAGGDPCQPGDWIKYSQPGFEPSHELFGVGHASFVKSPDAEQDWIIYHAKQDRDDGWRRSIFIQPFGWTKNGLPEFGLPVPATRPLPRPSGEVILQVQGPQAWDLDKASDLDAFGYFGHHQLIEVSRGRLHLGREPEDAVNLFRSGEKVVVTGGSWDRLAASVNVRVESGGRGAGLLFRCTLPSVGFDAQNGYFAGIIPASRRVVLGRTDGEGWQELALVDADVREGDDHLLGVEAYGSEIVISLDGKELIRTHDHQFTHGSVGLRVVDSHASFAHLTVNLPDSTDTFERLRARK